MSIPAIFEDPRILWGYVLIHFIIHCLALIVLFVQNNQLKKALASLQEKEAKP